MPRRERRIPSRQLAGDGPRENNVHDFVVETAEVITQLLEISFGLVMTSEVLAPGCDKTDDAMRIRRVHAERFARLIKYPDFRYILPKHCNLTIVRPNG
jgi:hypothetical protein